MLITDTTQRLGMNTMTHLFLQTFFCGDWYGKSITDELEWVVKELTYEEPDKKLMMELRIGLCHGGYVQNKTDVMFAYAMQDETMLSESMRKYVSMDDTVKKLFKLL